MISRYFIDKRVFVSGKDNRFLNLAGSYDLNDIVSQIVAGTLPGQPILPYVFNNGITLTGSDVQLGGPLVQDTIIDGNTVHSFEVSGVNNLTLNGRLTSIDGANGVNINSANSDINLTAFGQITATSGIVALTATSGDVDINAADSVLIDAVTSIEGVAPLISFNGDFVSSYLDHWKIENATVTIPAFGFNSILANGHYFSDAVRTTAMLVVTDLSSRKMIYERVLDGIGKYDNSRITDHNGTRIITRNTGSNDENRVEVNLTNVYFKGGTVSNYTTVRLGNTGINFDSHLLDGYTFPLIDGITGQTLITDGNGQLSWGSVATALTAQNGLNLVGTTVELGGPLTSDVTIDSTTFDLTIDVDDLDLRGNTVNMNSAADFDMTVVDDLSISTDRLLLTTSTTAFTGDVLSVTDGALGRVEPVRNRQTITFDVVAWNTTLVGAGQAQAFVMIPSYMNNWIIEEILVGVGQSALDPCDFSLEFSGGGSPYLVPITVAASTTFTASAVFIPVVTGDYVRVQNIVPGGSAPKGLTVTLTLRNN